MLVTQLCPTLCDPMDCSLPDSSVHGTLQARILEWVAIFSPGHLPDPRIEPRSPELEADSLQTEPPGKTQRKKVKGLGEYPFKRKKKFVYFWLCWVFFASWLFFSFREWEYSCYGPWAFHCSDFCFGARAHEL